MTRTQLKEAWKNITGNGISFLSVVIVITLGSGIFLACQNACTAMRTAGERFFESRDYHDLVIRSTHGISNADIEAVRSVKGIRDVEGQFTAELVAVGKEEKCLASVMSLTEHLDQPVLLDGRMPENNRECVLESNVADDLGLSPGDRIGVRAKSGEQSEYLVGNSFDVVGIVRHPDHYHVGHIETGYILVLSDAFVREAFDAEWNGMLISTERVKEGAFSDSYESRIQQLIQELGILSKERIALRDEEIRVSAGERIAEKEKELAQSGKELEKGKAALEQGSRELESAGEQLDTAASKLDALRNQLDFSAGTISNAEQKLKTAEKELKEAKKELDQGRTELDQAASALKKKEKELSKAKVELDKAKKQLDQKEKTLSESKQKLDTARTALDLAESALDSFQARLQAELESVWQTSWGSVPTYQIDFSKTAEENLKASLKAYGIPEETGAQVEKAVLNDSRWKAIATEYDRIPEGEASYEAGLAAYESGRDEWEKGQQEWEEKSAEYENARNELDKNQAALEKKEQEYQTSLQLWKNSRKEYKASLKEYRQESAALSRSRDELEAGEQQLSEREAVYQDGRDTQAAKEKELEAAEQAYQDSESQIGEARDALESLEDGQWIISSRFENVSFHELKETSRTFWSIGYTFAMLFVFLAALVCFATISKIIEDQRRTIGTSMALGLYPSEIRKKYLLFGITGSVAGSIGGVILGYAVLQAMILDRIRIVYLIGRIDLQFLWMPALLAVLLSVVIAVLASRIACRRLFFETANALLKDPVPRGRSRESRRPKTQKQRSVYAHLILNNIRSDWKRVLLSVISVAGCCVLLIIGFSLRISFNTLVSDQYEKIIQFDRFVSFLPETSETAGEQLSELVKDRGMESLPVYQRGTLARISTHMESVILISADPDLMLRYYHLTDERTGEVMRIPDGGAVITNGMAERYHLQPGDHFSIADERGSWHDLTVSGICHNYVGKFIYVSNAFALKEFGAQARPNTLALRCGSKDTDVLIREMKEVRGYLQTTDATAERAMYEETADAMNTVVYVMIVMAVIMAGVVLLNLMRIQLNQKKKELIVMRINGFSIRETVSYVLRENMLITLTGIAAGLLVGNAAAWMNLRSIDRVELQMMEYASPKAWILAAILTFAFSLIVNGLALQRIRMLKLNGYNN